MCSCMHRIWGSVLVERWNLTDWIFICGEADEDPDGDGQCTRNTIRDMPGAAETTMICAWIRERSVWRRLRS